MNKLRLVSHLVEHLEGLQQDVHLMDHLVVRHQKDMADEEGQGPFEHGDVIGQDGRRQGRPTATLNKKKKTLYKHIICFL